MASSDAVWGIDIGQCALKALKCVPSDQEGHIVAEAFDFVEYAQILSQPDADPAALIAEALQTFLSRNKVKGDRVAVSVSGQNGLARFIKIPPVEAKKIPDLVKYEARQQIPFALEEVIWDYQKMPGGVEEEGYVLDTEVGLFAMKREQVFKALKPLQDAGIEVDFVQLSPLAIYNFVNFDQISTLLDSGEANGHKWVVVLSMGTDTTELVVTNGGRVWQRSIPLGGNHFTRALMKELKLTFGKAEHLKRNAAQAPDAKALYQAMRGVFNDLVTEVHRSLAFFSSIEKEAEIKCVLAMGNTLKLQGLQSFLAKSLEYKVVGVEAFRNLEGAVVVNSPAFKDNLLAYGVSYGLCIQGLGEAKIHTNLLPREIITERIIRAKKPWAVAAVAAILLGMVVNYFGYVLPSKLVKVEDYKRAKDVVDGAQKRSGDLKQSEAAKDSEFKAIEEIGSHLTTPLNNPDPWTDLLLAIKTCLPKLEKGKEKPADLTKRPFIYVDGLDCREVKDLKGWYKLATADKTNVHKPDPKNKPAAPTPPPDGAPADGAAAPAEGSALEPGWVIEISAHHYHNTDPVSFEHIYVRDTFLANLDDEKLEVEVPNLKDGHPVVKNGQVEMVKVKLKDLGISRPLLIAREKKKAVSHPEVIPATGPRPTGGLGGAPDPNANKTVDRFDFKVQFAWKGLSRGAPQPVAPTATAAAGTATAGGE